MKNKKKLISMAFALAMASCVAGAMNAMMSGSGPTVFGIFDNLEAAKDAQRMIRSSNLAKQVYVTNVHNTRRK